jgi:hypothetical protein
LLSLAVATLSSFNRGSQEILATKRHKNTQKQTLWIGYPPDYHEFVSSVEFGQCVVRQCIILVSLRAFSWPEIAATNDLADCLTYEPIKSPMNLRKLSLVLLCLALGCALSAFAEEPTSSTSAGSVSTPAEVDHMVYLSFLPEPDELMKDAKANGLTVLRLDRTADKVIVSYKYPDGHTATLGYALLSAAGQADRIAAKRRVVESVSDLPPPSSTTEVVYVERPYPRTRVVYRDSYDDFWPPLILGLGIGYVSGHHSHWSGHGHYSRGYRRGGWHH